jgi:hypothetical protein
MEFLGVLLGITMSVVAVAIWILQRDLHAAIESNAALAERIALVEVHLAIREKKPVASRGQPFVRKWSEDAVPEDAK